MCLCLYGLKHGVLEITDVYVLSMDPCNHPKDLQVLDIAARKGKLSVLLKFHHELNLFIPAMDIRH